MTWPASFFSQSLNIRFLHGWRWNHHGSGGPAESQGEAGSLRVLLPIGVSVLAFVVAVSAAALAAALQAVAS